MESLDLLQVERRKDLQVRQPKGIFSIFRDVPVQAFVSPGNPLPKAPPSLPPASGQPLLVSWHSPFAFEGF